MTKVCFRKDFEYGEVMAVFPEVPWDRGGDLTCYAHIGQHGAVCPYYVDENTEPCEEEDYGSLLKELLEIGYDDLGIFDWEAP